MRAAAILLLAGCSAPGLPVADAVHFYPTINAAIVAHRCGQCHAAMFSASDSADQHHNLDAMIRLSSSTLMQFASEGYYCGPYCFTADEQRALLTWANGPRLP